MEPCSSTSTYASAECLELIEFLCPDDPWTMYIPYRELMVLRKSSWFIAKVLSSIGCSDICKEALKSLSWGSFHRLSACSTAILSFCVGFLSLFFFWTDGKRFAEFLLEEQQKKREQRAPSNKNNNHQGSKERGATVVLRPATHCTKGMNKNRGG